MNENNIKYFKPILYLALFMPLFFINIRTSHDWGDDFAEYIKQATNIVEGKAQSDVGYIFNPDNPFVGPPTVTVGFPVMLSPVCMIFGNNIVAFNYFISLLLLITGIVMIYLFKQYFSELIAILLSIILVYNPWTINFKCEILSDIPFTLVLILFSLIYSKIREYNRSRIYYVISGICLGYLILIRNIGIVVALVVATDFALTFLPQLLKKEKNIDYKSSLIKVALLLVSCFLTFFIINNILLPTKSSSVQLYQSLYTLKGIKETTLRNLDYYINNFQGFFHPQMTLWTFSALIIKAFALAMFFIGYFNSIIKKVTYFELLVVAYIVAICTYPNSTQGFRFLLPILPFMMIYVILGFKSIRLSRTLNDKTVVISIAVICILTYRTEITQVLKSQKEIIRGPLEPEAKEAFEFIKRNTKTTDTIVFAKPRALALYTGRYSFTNHLDQDSLSLLNRFNILKPHYFLLLSDIENQALRKFINNRKDKTSLLFKNSKFEFYKLN